MYRRSVTIMLAAVVAMMPVSVASQPGTPDPSTLPWPDGKPASPAMVELGKTLFFDSRLVPNQQQSCASCHAPQMGFADGLARDLTGHKDWSRARRNSPAISNLGWAEVVHWDGRTPGGKCFTAKDTGEEYCPPALEAQAYKSMRGRKVYEHFLPEVIKRPRYRQMFARAFPPEGRITHVNMAIAIAAFERSLVSNDSPYDRFIAGDSSALMPEARRGLEIFTGKGRCTLCHNGANFTDGKFHNVGLEGDDRGRAAVLEKAGDPDFARFEGAFKTPGLRNVALTAPYMHDGRVGTLEDVVELYRRGGGRHPGTSPLMVELDLSEREKWDLVAFLHALTDPIEIEMPVVPE